MPAASKQQQKLMGIVHALQKGGVKPSSVSKQAQKIIGPNIIQSGDMIFVRVGEYYCIKVLHL